MFERLRAFWARQRGWNVRYGELWMVQWQFSWWVSVGAHFDPKRRRVAGGPYAGQTYGPYLDLHLGAVILSLGWHPYLTGEIQNTSGIARGGISVKSAEPLTVEKVEWKWRVFVEIVLIFLLLLNLYGTYWRIKRGGLVP